MRQHKKFPGRHKFICHVDGMTYYSEDKRIRWDGAIVHKKNLEPRHPQELIKAVKENTSVSDPSPEVGYGSDQAAGHNFITTYATSALEVAAGEGSWVPTGSVATATLDMINYTDHTQAVIISASPTSAWSTGSYMTLGNGSTCYWNGAKWLAGTAP